METQTLKASSTNAKEVDNKKSSKELIVRKEVLNSPFTIITTEGRHFGVMGEYRITKEKSSRKAVEKELEEMTWNRIVQVIMILGEMKEKLNKETK